MIIKFSGVKTFDKVEMALASIRDASDKGIDAIEICGMDLSSMDSLLRVLESDRNFANSLQFLVEQEDGERKLDFEESYRATCIHGWNCLLNKESK